MKRDVILIVGKTGYGKSLWLKLYLRSALRVFAFDPAASLDAELLTGDAWLDSYDAGKFSPGLAFRAMTVYPQDLELVGSLAHIAGNCTLALEEFSMLHRRGESMPDWLSRLVFLGRHRSVSIVAVAQRAATIPVDVRSQVTRLISFNQSEPDDLLWMRPFLSRDEAGDCAALARGECFDIRPDGTKTRYSIASAVKMAYGFEISGENQGEPLGVDTLEILAYGR